jgi:BlaI family transcriptional regulator, penicillinase repressor
MPALPRKTREGLTPAQMEILSVLWELGEAGVADVWRVLGSRRAIARNTVQTMLKRLHERGWLHTREVGNAFLYSPGEKRASVLARVVGGLVDSAFGGSASLLVAALLRSRRLAPDEVARIRELIRSAEQAAAVVDGNQGGANGDTGRTGDNGENGSMGRQTRVPRRKRDRLDTSWG